jgi:hypothetical protein
MRAMNKSARLARLHRRIFRLGEELDTLRFMQSRLEKELDAGAPGEVRATKKRRNTHHER